MAGALTGEYLFGVSFSENTVPLFLQLLLTSPVVMLTTILGRRVQWYERENTASIQLPMFTRRNDHQKSLKIKLRSKYTGND